MYWPRTTQESINMYQMNCFQPCFFQRYLTSCNLDIHYSPDFISSSFTLCAQKSLFQTRLMVGGQWAVGIQISHNINEVAPMYCHCLPIKTVYMSMPLRTLSSHFHQTHPTETVFTQKGTLLITC